MILQQWSPPAPIQTGKDTHCELFFKLNIRILVQKTAGFVVLMFLHSTFKDCQGFYKKPECESK